MKKALVLSSGAAWGAFHIGALEYLVSEQDYNFDICAGTGIGAMNAAFVACGEFGALNEFWNRIGWLKLISFNWKHPLRDAPFTGKPQREFIQKHISIEKLEKQKRKLVFSTLNISTGEQMYFAYPGSDVPLMEALMGTVTVPGLTPPFNHSEGPLVEGTFVNSFILDHIVSNFEAEEYYGVAVLPAGDEQHIEKKEYTNWRQAMLRTLQINLSRDIHKGIKNGKNKVRAIRSYRQTRKKLEDHVRNEISKANARQAILDCIDQHYRDLENSLNRESEPVLHEILSKKEVESPLWSFRKKYIRSLKERGYQTAKKTMS